MLVAEIVSGERDWADAVFLIAIVLAVVASWNAWPNKKMDGVLGWLSVAAIALGWFLL